MATKKSITGPLRDETRVASQGGVEYQLQNQLWLASCSPFRFASPPLLWPLILLSGLHRNSIPHLGRHITFFPFRKIRSRPLLFCVTTSAGEDRESWGV